MARLTRKNIKVFAENATNNGVFGSLQAGNPVTTNNVEQVQSLPAWSTGWNSATMTSEKLPPLEEFQGVQYVTTYQQAYLMQEGIPEWASTVTYYKGSIAKEVTSNGFRIYYSLTNDNTNNLLSDTSNWKKVMDSSDLYAFDNNVVHLTGNEAIGGAKTFTSDIDIKKNFPAIFLRENDVVKGTNPQSEQGWTIYCQDSSNTSSGTSRLGFFSTRLGTNGAVITIMSAYKNEANSDDYASIRVYYPQSGSPYATCPTPTDTTSVGSTQIATVGWVNSVGNNVMHLTGTETIAGTKTFSSTIAGSINGNAATVTNGVYTTGNQTIGGTKTFSAAAYGTASDAINSILTTVNKSKNARGYFKLGNGMIIQWGWWSTGNTVDTVTFPIPFTAIPKVIGQINYNSTSGQSGITEKSTTSFKVYHASGISGDYIAIGY